MKTLENSREVLPMVEDGWIRVSSIPTMCAREEVLCAVEGLVREDTVPADLQVVFEHGHALHHQVQNSILARTDCLVGIWQCTDCGKQHGKLSKDLTLDELEVRPAQCRGCDGKEFKYIEQMFQDVKHRVQGHPDGFLRFPDVRGPGVLEIKSISPKGAWEVRGCPKMEHVIQAQCYMWLTGCRWAKILYWDKAGHGLSSFVEHTLEYDEDVIEKVKHMVQEIRDGIRREHLPDRICTAIDCPRALECPVAEACFAREV